jgi:hypothetical protein
MTAVYGTGLRGLKSVALPRFSPLWQALLKFTDNHLSSRVSSLGVIMQLRDRLRYGAKIAPAVVVALAIAAAASAQSSKLAARYSATMAELNVGSGVAISIDILRWSADEDADKLVAAFKSKSDKWGDTLDAAPSVGYVWASTSPLGYSIKLARQVPTGNGGSRVLLTVTPRLGSWDRPERKAAGQVADDPFTVIELRLNKAGVGEGKASLAAKVVADDAAKALALDNYMAAPVLLKSVKKSGAPGSATTPAAKPDTPAKPESARTTPKK